MKPGSLGRLALRSMLPWTVSVACASATGPMVELPEDRDTTRVRVIIPEAFELANIVMSLTNYGQQNNALIYKSSEYYQRVQSHFGTLRNGDAMRRMQLSSSVPIRTYYEYRDNSAAYGFLDNRIVHGTRYGTFRSPNTFREHLADLQAFTDASSFRQFYLDNGSYFAELIARYREIAQVGAMIEWLEREFQKRYDFYTVFFSPLIYGSHSAGNVRTELGDEVVMFVAGPDVDGGSAFSTAVRRGLVQRILFTEIDHLFVNPVSARYRTEIDRAFGDRRRWTTDNSTFYTSATDVFNEYMTWSVFFLFIDGRVPAQDFDRLLELSSSVMQGSRGFFRFGDFTGELLRLWRNRAPGMSVVELFPAILRWAGT